MLSIGIVKNPQDAARYYAQDDYYLNAGGGPDTQGQWVGRATDAMGLSGPVEREGFQALLDGTLPNGDRLGRTVDGKREHTPGWDLTFSAPKSVSILVEAGQDERLLQAHHAAVRDALKWTEENAIGTRVRTPTGTLFVRTGNMAAAVFTHHTSRAQDPNLHSHAVINNVTQRGDGGFGSLHSKELFANKMAIGQVYRSSLARRALELGYDIEKTHSDGRFEIVGVPEDLVQLMSSRRADIESKLAQWKASDPESAARAALMTRQRKLDVEHSSLVEQWREMTHARGFEIDALVDEARERGPRQFAGTIDVKQAMAEALERVTEPEAVFSHGQLVRWTLAGSLGTSTVQDVEPLIKQAAREQRLHRVDEAGRRLWTTPRARLQEQYALKTMLAGQGRFNPLATSEMVAERLSRLRLNDGQRAAVEMIATSADQFIGVVGRPGVGKTTAILNTTRDIARENGYTLIGMAQNALAAKNMQQESAIPSSTIDKHLVRVGRDLAGYQRSGAAKQLWIRFKHRNTMWIVDEAAQLSNGLARRLMYAAEKLNVRVLFIGDPQQQGAINSGKPFELLLKNGMQHTEVNEIVRQRNPEHRAAIHDAQAGKIRSALDRHAANITAVEDRDARLKLILENYRGLGAERENTLLLTARNQDKAALNSGVREILGEEQKLHGEVKREKLLRVYSGRADRRDAMFYQPGWKVRFNRDIEALGIKQGDYLTVVDADKKKNELILLQESDEGKRWVKWNPRKVGVSGKRGVEVYEAGSTALAPGETIRWARNSPGLGRTADGTPVDLTNGEILRVVSVEGNVTVFMTEAGVRVAVDHDRAEGRHWDHAYATTVYGSQGKTSDGALANADSKEKHLFSQRSFAVAISRHRDNFKMFVDSREDIETSLERNPGDKTSALEAERRHDGTRHAQLAEELDKEWRLAAAKTPTQAPERAQGRERQRD